MSMLDMLFDLFDFELILPLNFNLMVAYQKMFLY